MRSIATNQTVLSIKANATPSARPTREMVKGTKIGNDIAPNKGVKATNERNILNY